jgi:hypoxanthine phosphoribosyltransferase
LTTPQQPRVLFTREQIGEGVARLAEEINRDYRGKYPVLVGVLKGCFVFMADLVRLLDVPVEVDFAILSSYGAGKVSSGRIQVVQEPRGAVEGRDVLVVEDIVDTGLTISFFMDHLRSKKPASLKLCALFDKPSRRRKPITIDYLGLTVPDEFLVGYGLDYNEKYRNLPDLCVLEDQ